MRPFRHPPPWSRFRTRYFGEFVERGIVAGARQVVLLGGGFDMRAHIYRNPGVVFFEVDQKPVIDFKRTVLAGHGIDQPPSLVGNYLDIDVPGGLAETSFDLAASTLFVWEGNTMYLPPAAIMPFLNRLADAMPLVPHRLRLLRSGHAEPRVRIGGRSQKARRRGEGDGAPPSPRASPT